VVLDSTPFYAESGGQVGDQGALWAPTARCSRSRTPRRSRPTCSATTARQSEGALKLGDTVTAHVDAAVRAATMRNHSATHLMHKALRAVLGTHVQQKGSLVNAERTRFDFAHNAPVTDPSRSPRSSAGERRNPGQRRPRRPA
jgi:alanyl-tRNA synthetase